MLRKNISELQYIIDLVWIYLCKSKNFIDNSPIMNHDS